MDNKSQIHFFCMNVKMLRGKHMITKKDMSIIMGISVKTLDKIEKGILPPSLSCDVIFRISKVFKISPSALFVGPIA